MFKKFLPHEQTFFKAFQEMANYLEQAAAEFCMMVTDLAHVEEYQTRMSQLEKTADQAVRSTFELLHQTFFTPFDREHVHKFVTKLDDIIDAINFATQRIYIYRIPVLPQDILSLASLIEHASIELHQAIAHMHLLKKTPLILQHCDKVNLLESEGHRLSLKGIAQLFEEIDDFKTLLKIKDIYEYVKFVLYECEDLANLIKGIVLEYA